jgi:hypothetical protein
MLIWGLVMAKAKTGITASTTKDNTKVQSSWGKILKVMVLIGVVTYAQMQLEAP